MVATIDWFLEAGQLLSKAEANVKVKLIEYHLLSTRRIALLSVSPVIRNEKVLEQLAIDKQRAGDAYDEACKQVLKLALMISETPLYLQRTPLRAKLYWWWCCIKYRQL